jgi:hypothetical protein
VTTARDRPGDFPGLEPASCFTAENTVPLAAGLGIADGEIEALRVVLNDAAAAYTLLRYVGATAQPRPVRNRLAKLQRTAHKLLSQLDELDAFSERTLRTGFRDIAARAAASEADKAFPLSDEDDLTQESLLRLRVRRSLEKQQHVGNALMAAERMIEEVSVHVHRICAAISAGRKQLPRGDGRPSDIALCQLCLRLIQIYEELSGRRFRREKTRETWTDHAEWVANAARIVDPTLDRAKLNTAMRQAAAQSLQKLAT